MLPSGWKTSLGELHYRLANFDAAGDWLGQAREESREIGDSYCATQAAAWLVRVHCQTGACAAAADLLPELAGADGVGDPELVALAELAKLEAEALRPGSNLATLPHVAPGTDAEEERGTPLANFRLELACVAMEKLVQRSAPTSPRAAIETRRELAPDRCLRGYAA